MSETVRLELCRSCGRWAPKDDMTGLLCRNCREESHKKVTDYLEEAFRDAKKMMVYGPNNEIVVIDITDRDSVLGGIAYLSSKEVHEVLNVPDDLYAQAMMLLITIAESLPE